MTSHRYQITHFVLLLNVCLWQRHCYAGLCCRIGKYVIHRERSIDPWYVCSGGKISPSFMTDNDVNFYWRMIKFSINLTDLGMANRSPCHEPMHILYLVLQFISQCWVSKRVFGNSKIDPWLPEMGEFLWELKSGILSEWPLWNRRYISIFVELII